MEWISIRPLWVSLFYKFCICGLLLLLPLLLLLLLLLFLLILFLLLLLLLLLPVLLLSPFQLQLLLLVRRNGSSVVVFQPVRVHRLQLQLVHQRVSCLQQDVRKPISVSRGTRDHSEEILGEMIVRQTSFVYPCPLLM